MHHLGNRKVTPRRKPKPFSRRWTLCHKAVTPAGKQFHRAEADAGKCSLVESVSRVLGCPGARLAEVAEIHFAGEACDPKQVEAKDTPVRSVFGAQATPHVGLDSSA